MTRASGLDRPAEVAAESDSVGSSGASPVGVAVMVMSKVLVSVGGLTVVVFRGMLLVVPRLALVVKVAVKLPAVVVMKELAEAEVSNTVDSVPVEVTVPVSLSVPVPVSVSVSVSVAVSLAAEEVSPEPPETENWLV